MSQSLDKMWVQNELIPFLNIAYNVMTGHEPKKSEDWEREIERAEKRINTIVGRNVALRHSHNTDCDSA